MKQLIFVISAAMVLAACSSTPKEEKAEPINDQRLVSNFTRNNVKLEWSCKWGTGITEKTCVKGNIVAIEATGYATSFGNSEALRETAFSTAHDVALDKLVRFLKQDLTSSRVTNTLTRNVERANDAIKNNAGNSEVAESDNTAQGPVNSNTSNRNNVNETVRTVIENIRTQANGIVRGAQVVDESVVDKQTVSVTVRWSITNAEQVNKLRGYFK